MDLAGIKNVTSKILGTNNKVNNAKCTILALSKLKRKTFSPKKDSENKVNKDKNSLETADKKEIKSKK
jgi:ribosomal protein S5